MKNQENERRWQRLTRLLEPIHEKAATTARNLGRSTSDGDDLFQEAVLRAFNKLHTLRDEARFRSWFFAVLLSVHRSRGRRAFWRRFLPMNDPGSEEAAVETGRDHEEEFLAARRASRALSRLPAVQREALVLYELEGFAMDEIAAMQGVTVSAVKSRLSRGRDRLRGFYEARGWSPEGGPVPAAQTTKTGSFRTETPATGELVALFSSTTDSTIGKGGRHE